MKLRIRIGGYQNAPSVHSRAVNRLIEALLAQTGTRVSVEFHMNVTEHGRKATDLLGMVASGDLDLCYFTSGYLAGRVTALGVLDIPFHFTDREQTRAQLDGSFGGTLRRAVAAATAYEVLAFWDNGLRHLSNRVRPIRAPEDCSGLRIRTLPSPGYHATFRALGMEPVDIDVGQMVAAVADGTVDAQENPLTNIQLFGLQKYHPFVTMTGHFHGIALLLCNARSWAGWPEEVRAALTSAVQESTAAQWAFAAEEDVAARAALEAAGVAIVDLDARERAAFARAVGSVIDQAWSTLPPELSLSLRD
jgi:TRAP-type transport system periplasmic protein